MLITPAQAAPSVMSDVESCHVLDASSVPGAAFAAALSRLVPTTAWVPKLSLVARPTESNIHVDVVGKLRTVTFVLQRGFTKTAVNRLLGITDGVFQKVVSQCRVPSQCVLICTSPFLADVAERWPGPTIYYSLDFTYAYTGFSPKQVLDLDKRLCHVATLVCAVSERIRDYLVARAGCDANKIAVLPNATLSENVRKTTFSEPGAPPLDLQDLPRPIAGVIGNMADNLDWILLKEAIEKVPQFSWIFVGPADSKIADAPQSAARKAVMKMGARVRFLGERPYVDLQSYARALDVAVLPYRRREPTYSGSATRYYEHLAAARPMVATRNVAELLSKEPFVSLIDNAGELVVEMERLQQLGFDDGLEEARIRASRDETWDARAQSMMRLLAERWMHPAHEQSRAAVASRGSGEHGFG